MYIKIYDSELAGLGDVGAEASIDWSGITASVSVALLTRNWRSILDTLVEKIAGPRGVQITSGDFLSQIPTLSLEQAFERLGSSISEIPTAVSAALGPFWTSVQTWASGQLGGGITGSSTGSLSPQQQFRSEVESLLGSDLNAYEIIYVGSNAALANSEEAARTEIRWPLFHKWSIVQGGVAYIGLVYRWADAPEEYRPRSMAISQGGGTIIKSPLTGQEIRYCPPTPGSGVVSTAIRAGSEFCPPGTGGCPQSGCTAPKTPVFTLVRPTVWTEMKPLPLPQAASFQDKSGETSKDDDEEKTAERKTDYTWWIVGGVTVAALVGYLALKNRG